MSLRLFRAGDTIGGREATALSESVAVEPLEEGYRFRGPGVLAISGDLVVVLPRGHPMPAAGDRIHAAIRLLACLSLYRRDPRRRSVGDEDVVVTFGEMVDRNEDLDALEAALLLLEDWLAHGRIVLAGLKRGVDLPGRIHWQRSERFRPPLASPTGLQFPHFVAERVQVRRTHPLVALHEAVCLHLARRFGEWVIDGGRLPPTGEARAVLGNEGRAVYSDRPKRVVNLLRRFYSGHGEKGEQHGMVRGLVAPHFALVWERAVQVALGHSPVSAPWAGRYFASDAVSAPGLNVRPDVLVRLRLPDRLLVLDAKDYAKSTWPPSADISKQMVYRLLASAGTEFPLERIGNGFLFPGEASPVRRRATHRLLGNARGTGLATISCLEVDLPTVLDAYRSGRVDSRLVAAVVKEMREDFPALKPSQETAASVQVGVRA